MSAGSAMRSFSPPTASARLPDKGEEVFLHIHTNVREDAMILFGFLEEQEKELFLILKTVTGIGPKLALAMLSGMRVSELCRAIAEGDIKRLTISARGRQKDGRADLRRAEGKGGAL